MSIIWLSAAHSADWYVDDLGDVPDILEDWDFTDGWNGQGGGSVVNSTDFETAGTAGGISKSVITVGETYFMRIAGTNSSGNLQIRAGTGLYETITGSPFDEEFEFVGINDVLLYLRTTGAVSTVSLTALILRKSDTPNYYILKAEWGLDGLPKQPSAEWRLGDGEDYDTLGATGFINYGDSVLVPELTIGVVPGLQEGILSEGQSTVEFDGVNDFLEVDEATNLDIVTQDFSMAIWIRTTTAIQDPVGGKRSGFNEGYSFLVLGTGAIVFNIEDADNDGGGSFSTTLVNDGNWHYCVGTYNNVTGTKIYVDAGPAENSNVIGDANGSLSNATNFLIGSNVGSFGEFECALMQFWKGTELTEGEITAMYNAMKPDGDTSRPFPSIQSACHAASNGDTILVSPGTYTETVATDVQCDIVSLDTTFGNRAVLDGGDLPAAAGENGFALTKTASEISYLDIIDYQQGNGYGVWFTQNTQIAHHILVSGCKIGVQVSSASEDSLVNCTIYDNTTVGIQAVKSGAGVVNFNVVNSIISDNVLNLNEPSNLRIASDYNVWFNNGTETAPILGYGGNDLFTDPRFNDVSAKDFRTLGSSAKIGKAWRLFASPPRGAYDWIGSTGFVNNFGTTRWAAPSLAPWQTSRW